MVLVSKSADAFNVHDLAIICFLYTFFELFIFFFTLLTMITIYDILHTVILCASSYSLIIKLHSFFTLITFISTVDLKYLLFDGHQPFNSFPIIISVLPFFLAFIYLINHLTIFILHTLTFLQHRSFIIFFSF